jgi:3-phenylpropionate/trans-cinnamate dioxygenase ferredoxin component
MKLELVALPVSDVDRAKEFCGGLGWRLGADFSRGGDRVVRRISVARVDGRLYAFDDLCTCTGEACPLSGGLLTGTTIMCQCHGSRFDISTGAVINGPATEPLHVYEVQEVEGSIHIRA